MTTPNQTLAQKFRVLLEAVESGDKHVRYTPQDGMPLDGELARMWDGVTISRIPKPTPKIRVGDRLINAPMQEEPKAGTPYWVSNGINGVEKAVWDNEEADIGLFAIRACWHTPEDAHAYNDATLALRSTLVEGEQ